MTRTPMAILLALAAASGCSSNNTTTTATRGIGEGSQQPVTPAPAPAEEEEPPAEPEAMRRLPSPFAPGPGDLTAEQQPAEEAAAETEEQPERDLGAELGELVRRSGCLDLAAAARLPGGRLRISVSAYVMGSGRITRATVSAPGQPSAALRCAEQRIVASGLSGPVPDAPANVSGETLIEVLAAAQPEPAAPEPAQAPPPAYPPPTAAPPPPANAAATTSSYTLERGAQPDQRAGSPDNRAPEIAGPP